MIVETKAGTGIDFSDQDYVNAGATIAADAAEVFAEADMIVKVKEPQAQRDRDAASRGRCCSPTCTSRRSGADQGADGVGRDLHRL